MTGEIESSLNTLRDRPQDQSALTTLQELLGRESSLSGDALEALSRSVQHHREHGNWETVVQLIDLQLPLLGDPQRQAELLALKGHVCEYELLDETSAIAAFERAIALRPEDEATRETLEHITLLRENWERVAQKYVEEAEASSDRQLATSFYLSAAEVVWRNRPDSAQVEEYLRRSLEVEPRNRKASAHLERLLRRGRRFQEVAKLLEQRADVAADKDERIAALLAAGELWAVELGNAEEAVSRYRRALALEPGDPAALGRLVAELTRQQSWPALVRLYEEALRGRPAAEQEAGILLQIGLILDRKLGQADQAEEYFRRVRKLDPTHPLMLDFYRSYYRQRGEHAKTLALLDAAARMEARPERRLALGREMAETAEEGGNLEKAIDLWKSIQRAAPTSEEPMLALKRLYRTTQPPKWNALRELIKDEIDHLGEDKVEEKIRLLLEVVEIYRDHLRLDVMVINTYNAILALRPEHEEAIEALAQKYEAMGRWNDLIGLLMRRKEVQPDAARKIETLRRVAALWIDKFGNQSQAIKPLEEILSLDPRDAAAIAALRDIHTRRRNWRELMELLRAEAAAAEPGERRKLYKEMAALAADKLGDPREGIQVWNNVLEQDPADAEALAELVMLYRREERWPALAEVLHRQAAAARSPEEKLAIYESLGDLYTNRLRAVGNAISVWREVLALRPDAPKARVVLRELYVQEQRWEDLDALYRSRGELAELCETLSAAADRTQDRALKIRLFTQVGANWVDLDSPERATKAYERVLASDPQNAIAARALVPLYRGAEKWARLHATYEILLNHAELLDEKLALLAEIRDLCERHLSSKNLAFSWCARAFELAPDRTELRVELERLAAEADAWEEMVALLARRLASVTESSARAALLRDLAELCMERLHKPEQAEGYYRQLLELDPQDLSAVDSLQQIYTTTQRWPELVAINRRRVALESAVAAKVDLLFKIAFLEEERRGDPVAAIDALREIVELDAGNQRALRALDRLYQVRSEWSSLVGVLKRQLELEPDREAKVELLFRLATVHKLQLEEHAPAIDVYAQVLGLDPIHRPTVQALEGYLDAGEPAEATRVASLLQPYYERVEDWAKLARVHAALLDAEDQREARIALLKKLFSIQARRLNNADAAFAAGSSLLALDPSDADHRREMSALADTLGRTDELAGLLSDALHALPAGSAPEVERAIAWELAVVLDERLGRPDEAERHLRRVIELDPAQRDAFDALERILRDDGKWNELRDLLEKRKELAQAPALRRDILVQISALNEDVLGDVQAAVRAYEEILQIDPGHGMSLRALERHYAAASRWQDLIDLYRREMDFAPDDATLNDLKLKQAELLAERLQDPVAAVDLLEEVVSLDPNLQPAVDLLERLMNEQDDLRRRVTEILEPVYERRETYRDLARILLVRRALARDRFEAVELLRRSASLNEEQLNAREPALALYREALLLEPGAPALQDAVERLTTALSAWVDAAAAWRGAADAADPADLALRGNLLQRLAAVYDERLADNARARESYEQLLALDPTNLTTARPATDALVRLYQESGLWSELIEALRRKLAWSDDRTERQELMLRIAAIQEEQCAQTDAAVATFHELLEENPAAAAALDALERIYLAGERWRDLVGIYQRRVALASSPEARRVHWLRIATIQEAELHDLDEATAAYLALLGDLPNDLEALRAVARIYRLGERWPDLLDMLERELPLAEPGERTAVLFEAATLQHRQLGAAAAAVERYREVLAERPDHHGARSALEELLADPDLRLAAAEVLAPIYEAENSWERLVQVLEIKASGAESAAARVPLLKRIAALCEDGIGDLERAFDAWRRASLQAAAEPGLLELTHELGRAGRSLEKHGELCSALEVIIPEVPDPQVQRELHLECARLAREALGDAERARRHYQSVLDGEPENRTALEALDALYTSLEHWEALQEILTRRVELAADDLARRDLLLRSAMVWRDQLAQPDEAIADFEQVLGLFASDRAAIEALDGLYTTTERWSSLAELLERRLALSEDREEQVGLYYRLGELRAWKMSDPAGAITAYQSVLQLDGSHGPAIAALEAYLDDADLRVEAAQVLEVIYVGRQDWPRLIRIYQIRLDSAEEPERRLWLSTRIAQLYEEQLEDLEGAFTWYGKVFLEKPSDGGIRDQLLRLAGILERWAELAAIFSQHLEQTLEEGETTREVALMLGGIYDERLNDVEHAAACFRRQLDANRDDEDAFQRLESLLTRYDRWHDLLALYQEAADAAADQASRRELLLKVCRVWEEALENLPEAIDAYRAVLDLDERDEVPVEALDRLYTDTGRWQEQADLLARRAELATSEADQVAIKYRLATIYELRIQDLATAIDLYEEVLRRDPQHVQAVTSLERLILERDQRFRISQILEPIYRRQDEWAKLVVIYDAQLDFIEDAERRQFLFREIARLHEERDGSLELAFRAIARAFLEDPASEILLQECERLAARLGSWADLVHVLEKGSEGLYDYAVLARLGAKVAAIHEERMNDRNAAVAAWRRVLSAQEDHADAIAALVRLYEVLGRNEELIEILTRRAELTQDPEQRKPTYYRIAEIYEQLLGRAERAIDTYRQVLALDESDRVTLAALERLYLAAGSWIDLIWIYRRKLEISTEVEERRTLQRQIASVYEEKLGDRFEAIAAYKTLYQDTPEDPGVLDALDRLFTAEALHADLLEVLEAKIRLEGATEHRLDLLCRAAEILEMEIGDLDGAIERYRQVIEADVSNRVARTALERLVRSADAHREILSQILENVYLKTGENLPLCEVLELRLEGIGEPDSRRDLLVRIARLAEEGLADDRRAFNALGRALSEDPAHPDVQREIDRIAAKLGALGELVQVYEERLSGIYDPALLRAIHLKVAALLEHDLKEDERAIEHYRSALECGGGDELDPLRALDRIYERQGRAAELCEILGREIQAVTDPAVQSNLSFRLGQVQQRQGDLDGAFASYRDALERDASHAGAHTGMESLLSEESYRSAALDVLEPIAEARGDHAKLVQLIEVRLQTIDTAAERSALLERIAAIQEEKLGAAAEALGALGRAIAEEPGNSRTLDAAERLAATLGRFRELAALGEEVLSGELGVDAVRELGLRVARWTGEQLGEVERSEKILKKVLEADPDCVSAMESLERIYRATGRDADLCDLLVRRAEAEPDVRQKHKLLAEVAAVRERSLGDLAGACAAWRAALEADSESRDALGALGGLLLRTEAWEEYLDVLERRGALADSADERIALKYEAAEVLIAKLEDPERAVEVYKDILDLNAMESRAIDALEAIYAAQESWSALSELLHRRLDNRSGGDRVPVLLQLAEIAATKLGLSEDAAGYYGQVLAEDGEHLEAMGSLERILRESGKWYDLVDVLKRHAEVLARRGDTAGEVEQLVRAARVWNDSLANPEAAAELLEEILRRDANNVNALAGLARIYETTRRWDRCREVLERAAALGPAPREAAELEFRMGRVQIEESGDEAAAATRFSRALELDAEHEEAAAALEAWSRKHKDWARLAELLERRVSRAGAGDQLSLLRELGALYTERLGQADRGVEALERARQIAPDASDVLTALADGYFAAAKYDLAAPLIQKLIDLAGGKKRGKELAQLTYRMGAIAEKRGDPAAAREHYDQAYKMDSTHGPTLVALGRIYVDLQDWQNVRKLFRSMLLQNMDESSGITKAEVFYRLGQSHAELGEKSKAITMFERGLEVDAGHEGLRAALAKVKGQ